MTIVSTPDAPFPQVEIVAVDSTIGTILFNWLDAQGARVDSGGSVARFTPVIDTEATETDPAIYAEPDDAALAAAITTPPSPSIEEFIASATAAVQALLDARAQQSGYDGILSAASYAADPTGVFTAEGQAFSTWRSTVWAACYTALGAHDPADPVPGLADFLATLPDYAPPA